MTRLLDRRDDLAVTLHSAVATLAAPTGTAGGDTSAWMSGERGLSSFVLRIDGSATMTLDSAKLCMRDAADDAWRVIADLNDGATINLTATLGWERPFSLVVGSSRLAVQATVAGGNVTVSAVPIEEID